MASAWRCNVTGTASGFVAGIGPDGMTAANDRLSERAAGGRAPASVPGGQSLIDAGPLVEPPPICALRKARGLTLNQLAAAIAMDPAHLDLIERQSQFAAPTRQELEAIARALSCSVDEIRGRPA
jgi:DNA-binding Xre family transcriptional regulator